MKTWMLWTHISYHFNISSTWTTYWHSEFLCSMCNWTPKLCSPMTPAITKHHLGWFIFTSGKSISRHFSMFQGDHVAVTRGRIKTLENLQYWVHQTNFNKLLSKYILQICTTPRIQYYWSCTLLYCTSHVTEVQIPDLSVVGCTWGLRSEHPGVMYKCQYPIHVESGWRSHILILAKQLKAL